MEMMLLHKIQLIIRFAAYPGVLINEEKYNWTLKQKITHKLNSLIDNT